MRLAQIHIQGFGVVRDKNYETDAPVVLFYGPNEAGKSTVLYFIRAMLYGFPAKNSPAERGEPVDEGVHGGELRLRAEDGTLWVVRRYSRYKHAGSASARGERLSIHKENTQGSMIELGQQELEEHALGQVSKDLFRQLFAISLTELQEVRILHSSEMSGYLLHAGIGGGANILAAERQLLQEMDKLYKPRGKVQHSAKLLQSIEQLKAQVRERRGDLPRYNEIVQTIKELQEQLERLDTARASQAEDLSLLRKAMDIRPQWLNWCEARLELDDLQNSGVFPPDGMARWEKLQQEGRLLSTQSARVERALDEVRKKREALPIQEVPASYDVEIEELWSGRNVYEAGQRELAELTTKYQAQAARIEQLLRHIDPSWNEQKLLALSTSGSERGEVRRYAADFGGYDRRMEALIQEHRAADRSTAGAESNLREAQRQLLEEQERGEAIYDMIKPTSPNETSRLWNQLQLEMERWREQRWSGPVSETQPRQLRSTRAPGLYSRLLIGMAVITTLLIAVLSWLGAAEAAIGSGLIMLLGMGYVFMTGRREAHASGDVVYVAATADDQEIEEAMRLYASLISSPYAAAGTGLGSRKEKGGLKPDPLLLEGQMRELRSLMEGWQSWRQRIERLSSECKSVEEKVRLQVAELQRVQHAIQHEEQRFHELERRWETWLKERDLPMNLSPDTLLDIFAEAEQGQEWIRQQRALRLKIDELLNQTESYTTRSNALLRTSDRLNGGMIHARFGSAIDRSMIADCVETVSAGAVIAELRQLYTRWQEYKEALRERDMLDERMQELHEEQMALRSEQAMLKESEANLLQLAQAADEEGFMRIGAEAQRRDELNRNVRHLEISMFSGCDEQRKDELLQLLQVTDAEGLSNQLAEREQEAASMAAMRDEWQERRGRLLQEQESLAAADKGKVVIQQLEEQRSALKEQVAQYAVRSIAVQLIQRTRRMYEEEKQPHVLKLASRYFSVLTGGTYHRILMRMGDQTLLVERAADKQQTESSRLSRGTAEQLYLAMRLGLIQSMPHAAGMPLILDDLFVNFDGERLNQALALITELSQSRQIMLMTCHKHVAEQVQLQVDNVKLIVM